MDGKKFVRLSEFKIYHREESIMQQIIKYNNAKYKKLSTEKIIHLTQQKKNYKEK